MTKKEKQIYGIIAAIILIILAVWLAKTGPESQDQQSGQNTEQNKAAPKPNGQPTLPQANIWMGALKNSDNTKKGNLMLVTKNHTIYLQTSRDYSSLVGKNVSASYSGSLESFTLIDIKAAD